MVFDSLSNSILLTILQRLQELYSEVSAGRSDTNVANRWAERRGRTGRGEGGGEGAREERKWVGEKGRDGVGEKGVGEGGSKEGKNREEGTCRVHMYMYM